MFEQTFLPEAVGRVRGRAMAVSLAMQSALLAIAVLCSMWYLETMPRIDASRVFAPPPPPRALPVAQTARTVAGAAGLVVRQTFHLPSAHPGPLIQMETGTELPLDGPLQFGPALAGTGLLFGTGPAVPMIKEPPPPPAQQVTKPHGPVRVSEGVLASKLLHRVLPSYPPIARQIRLSGVVHLLGIVGTDGRIRELRVVNGHPFLAQAALEAVRQWVYSPTLLNREPVEVVAPIEVRFSLQ